MAFLPRTFITGDNTSPSFHPLFRLLEDFDSYSQRDESRSGRKTLAQTFQPKFDVREVETGYELHGELAGIEQKDVEIEFTDSQTLNIRGKVEREYTSTSDEKPEEETKKIESHQPSVEDEPEYDNADTASTTAATTVAKGNESEKQVQQQQQQPKKPTAKFWASERSIGTFSRVFTFSQPIDHDNVKASMKNGLLSIFVPKKKAESRRIQIE